VGNVHVTRWAVVAGNVTETACKTSANSDKRIEDPAEKRRKSFRPLKFRMESRSFWSMNDLYLSTGKAARALGVNADSIRRLCEAGAIQAVVTPGGQWRVPTEEIERLKRDGMPPVSRPLPQQVSRTPAPPAPVVNGKHSGLLADPSDETVAAADECVRLESEVRALGLKRQREEALDWFRQREQDEEDEVAEQQKAEAAHDAEDRERDRHRYMQGVPREAQGEVELQLHAKVKAALVQVDADEPDTVVRRLVDGVIAVVLKPWHRRAQVQQAVEEAVAQLPYGAQAWEERARTAAREAVDRLGPDADLRKAEQAVAAAVSSIEAQYAAEKAAEADTAERERLLRWIPLELERAYSESGVELALKAVNDAWAKLPVGTVPAKLEAARDAAVQPFRQAIADREAFGTRGGARASKAATGDDAGPVPHTWAHHPAPGTDHTALARVTVSG
jgi:excisionase family DNA binding protein